MTLTTNPDELLFRASACGKLMIGGNIFTAKQQEQLEQLQQRDADHLRESAECVARISRIESLVKLVRVDLSELTDSEPILDDDIENKKTQIKKLKNRLKNLEVLKKKTKPTTRPLTDNMRQTIADLIEKRDAPFEFGATALTHIKEVWLRKEFGYDEPVVTPTMLKGNLQEQDSIGLVSEVIKSDTFRVKNEENFKDEYFTGTPDVVLFDDGVVEDVKTCWTLKTYTAASPSAEYFAQVQVYMHLTGCKKARLIYTLIDTDDELIEEEKKRYFFKFGADDQNPHYLECCHKLDLMHKVSPKIETECRVKVFFFDYDPDYIAELQKRVRLARKVYKNINLVDPMNRWDAA